MNISPVMMIVSVGSMNFFRDFIFFGFLHCDIFFLNMILNNYEANSDK